MEVSAEIKTTEERKSGINLTGGEERRGKGRRWRERREGKERK